MAEKEVFINIELGLTAEAFEKELNEIEKNIKPLEVPLEFDLGELQSVLSQVKQVVGEVNKIASGVSAATGKLNIASSLSSVENEINAGFKNVLQSLNKKIEESLKGAINFVVAPFKEIFSGIFTQVGMSISQGFSNAFVRTLENQLGKSLTEVGSQSADFLSKQLNQLFKPQQGISAGVPDLYKAIFQKTAAASGVKVDDAMIPKLVADLNEGAAAKYSQKTNSIHISKQDYDRLKSGQFSLLDIDTLAHEFRHAMQLNFGQAGKGLGVNLLRGTKEELRQLEKEIQASTQMAGRGQSQDVVNQIQRLETDAYVFALRNAQKIYDSLQKPSPRLSQTQQSVKAGFVQQQQQFLDEATKSNIAALEQLTRSQLLQIAKSADVTGVNKLKIGDLRSKLVQSVSPEELSFRIPTFSKPATEIASITQGLLSQPVEGIRSSINAFSKQIQSTIKANTKQIDSTAVRSALDDIQKQRQTYSAALAQDIDKETRDVLKAAIARLGKQRIALQSRLTVADAQLNQVATQRGTAIPQNVQLYRAMPQSTFEGFYQNFERRLYNSPGLRNLPDVVARSTVAEATGFLFSGAAMAAPLQTALASIAPLAVPLTPILATGVLVANVVNPIVGAVTDALKKIEPIRRRFESSLGGTIGAQQEEAFAREIVDKYQVPLLPALNAYSQLTTAARGKPIEGEQTRELFEGISVAIKAIGADAESARLIYYAFTQMLSKGTISMEELRCYDRDTEVLTLRGWVRWDEVSDEDLFASKNLETGKVEYQKPIRRIQYRYDGLMLRVNSSDIDLLVTPDHRMVVRLEKGTKFEIVKAKNLAKSESYFYLIGFDTNAEVLVDSSSLEWVEFEDEVFCVEVPFTTLYVRRDGKSCWSGNSQLGEKFPPTMEVFSKAIGVSDAELNKLVESGKLLSVDVLPKVSKQLLSQYGPAVAAATNDFITAQVRLENTVFKIQEGLAKSYGPILTGATNAFAGLLNIVSSNMDNIVKTFNIALIGLGAQFFVGLSVILKSTGILQTVANGLAPLFGRAFATLTPFFVGTFIDMIDDVLGAQSSVMDNMMKGFYNFFAATISAILAAITKLQEVVNGVTLATSQATGGFLDIGNALNTIRKNIPSVLVEFAALTLMLNQTYILGKLALGPVIADLVASMRGLAASFITSVRTGKIFEASLGTLTAGLTKSQLGMMALTAATIIFFAKADFTNEMGQKFDAMGTKIVSSLDKIREAAKLSGEGLDNFKKKIVKDEFKSKGFDWTLGLGEQFIGNPIRTDDLIKLLEDEEGVQKAFKEGRVTQEQFNDYTQRSKEYFSLAEKIYYDNLLKLNDIDDVVGKTIDSLGILSNAYKNQELGKAIDGVKKIDSQVKELQERRVKLLSRPDADTSKPIKDEVAQLDSKVKSLLKERDTFVKPFADVKSQLDEMSASVQAEIQEIYKRTDIPKAAREEAAGRLNATLSSIKLAQKVLERTGVEIIPQLGVDFQQITRQITEQDTLLDKTLAKGQKTLTTRNAELQEALASEKISQPLYDVQKDEAERTQLEAKITTLNNYIQTRKAQIQQLLLLPSPTKDQQDVISKNQKTVLEKESDLAQAREQLAKRNQEATKRTREQYYKDFEEAEAILESRRKQGLISEQAFFDKQEKLSITKGQEQLRDIKARRSRLSATDKEGLEALAVEEAAAYGRMADARKTRYDQQFDGVKQATDRAQAYLESQRKRGLTSEQQAAVQSVALATQSVNAQMMLIRQRLAEVPKTDTTTRDTLLLQEQQVMAAVADARKAAFDTELNTVKTQGDQKRSIAQSAREQGLNDERETAQKIAQLQIEQAQRELELIRQRRAQLNAADKEGLDRLIAQEAETLASISKARKQAFDSTLSDIKADSEKRLAILSGDRARGQLDEAAFNEAQYQERQSALDEELKLINQRRQEISVTDVEGQLEAEAKEAEIYGRRIENQKAFLDTQLQLLDREQQKAKDATIQSAKEREIELQKLINARIFNEEEARAYSTQIAREGIEEDLRLEREKLTKLEAFPKYNDPVAEEDRQTKIRASRIRTTELQLQLLQNEKQQQEAALAAYTKAIERITQAIQNRATVATQSFTKELQLNSALEKSLSRQNQLLDAQKSLRSALSNYIDAELQVLQETASTEQEKKELAETQASLKLNAVRQQIELDRQSLELQILQTEQAQQRLEIENAIAQIKNRAETAKLQAEVAKVESDPNATPEQKEAAKLAVVASRFEGDALQQEAQLLAEQRAANEQINRMRRQGQLYESSAQLTKAEFDQANAIADRDDRALALERLQRRSKSRLFGADASANTEGEYSSRLSAFNESQRNRLLDNLAIFGEMPRSGNMTPLQAYMASDVANRLMPALPNTVTPQALPMFDKAVNTLGTAVDSLVQLVQKKLSTPNNVTVSTPINNYFTTPNPKDAADAITKATRQQLYNLGVELQRT